MPRAYVCIARSRRALQYSAPTRTIGGGAVRRNFSCLVLGMLACTANAASGYRERLPEDEIVYFVLPDRFENGDPANDRGGLSGDRLTTGFDPSHKGFYHGGDLKGLVARLDYIQGLGAT